jgi:hypothetical protein
MKPPWKKQFLPTISPEEEEEIDPQNQETWHGETLTLKNSI